jgi:hypothetical protein
MRADRRGAGDWVPFIQQRRNVLIAGILNLSSGGSSATSTLVADGSNRYPPSIDQIAAASTGNMTNRIADTTGHANSAKKAKELGSAISSQRMLRPAENKVQFQSPQWFCAHHRKDPRRAPVP